MNRSHRLPLILSLLVVVGSLFVYAPQNVSASVARADDFRFKQVAFTPDGGWIVLVAPNGYVSKDVPTELTDKLDELIQDHKEVRLVSFTADGGWIAVYATNSYVANGAPKTLTDKLDSLKKQGFEITDISFNPDGEWVILYGANRYDVSKKIPSELTDKLDELIKASRTLKRVVFNGAGKWVVLYNENRYSGSGLDKDLTDSFKDVADKGWSLNNVSFMKASGDSKEGWILLYGTNGVISKSVPSELMDKLKEMNPGK